MYGYWSWAAIQLGIPVMSGTWVGVAMPMSSSGVRLAKAQANIVTDASPSRSEVRASERSSSPSASVSSESISKAASWSAWAYSWA